MQAVILSEANLSAAKISAVELAYRQAGNLSPDLSTSFRPIGLNYAQDDK